MQNLEIIIKEDKNSEHTVVRINTPTSKVESNFQFTKRKFKQTRENTARYTK